MLDFIKDLFLDYLPDPAGVHFTGEDKGEVILLLLRRHVITNVPWLFVALGMLVVPFVVPPLLDIAGFPLTAFLPVNYILVLGFFWYLITLTFIFESYLTWYSNVYIVTNKRVIDVDFYGLLNVRVSEAPIPNIEDVTYSIVGVWGTFFNFGSVSVQTAGEARELEFEFIPKPAIVHDKISDLATEVRNAKS